MLSFHKLISGHVIKIIALTILCSCATRYTGPAPDYLLGGAEKISEIQKFELDESFGGQGLFVLMGPNKTDHTIASVEPIIKDASPAAYRDFRNGQLVYTGAMMGAVLFFAGGIVAELNDQRPLAAICALGSLASATTAGISAHLYHQEGAKKFNKDIHKKFTPALSYQKLFNETLQASKLRRSDQCIRHVVDKCGCFAFAPYSAHTIPQYGLRQKWG